MRVTYSIRYLLFFGGLMSLFLWPTYALSTPASLPTRKVQTKQSQGISLEKTSQTIVHTLHYWKQFQQKFALRTLLKHRAELQSISSSIEKMKKLRLFAQNHSPVRLDWQFTMPFTSLGISHLVGKPRWGVSFNKCLFWWQEKGVWKLLHIAETCKAKEVLQWSFYVPKKRATFFLIARKAQISFASYFGIEQLLEELRKARGKVHKEKMQVLFKMSQGNAEVTSMLLERIHRITNWLDIGNTVIGGNKRVLRQMIARAMYIKDSKGMTRMSQLLVHMHVKRRDPLVLPYLKDAFQKTNSANAQNAILYILRKIGKRSSLRSLLPLLKKSLSGQEAVHLETILTLKTQAPKEGSLLPVFTQALDHRKWIIVSHAADAIGLYKQRAKSAIHKLKQTYVRNSFLEVRRSVLNALTNIAPARQALLPFYKKALRAKKRALLLTALRCIYRLGPKATSAIPALVKLTDSAFLDVRLRSFLVLKRFKSKAAPALPALRKALQHRSKNLRITAAGVFGWIGKAASGDAALLLRYARQARIRKVRQNLYWSLFRIDAEVSIKRKGLLYSLQDKSPQIRYNALKVLTTADAVTSLIRAQLERMRRDPHPTIRKKSIHRLRSLPPLSRPTSRSVSRPSLSRPNSRPSSKPSTRK